MNIPNESMNVCSQILSPEDQDAIERAAKHAHQGNPLGVRTFRQEAGYGEQPGGYRNIGPLPYDGIVTEPQFPPNHGGFPDNDPRHPFED